MFKAVIFDLDGTLADSVKDLANGVNYVLNEHGFPMRPPENYRYYAGDGIPKMIARALPQEAATPENIEKIKQGFFAYYNVHYNDNTVSYSGLPEMIDKLKQHGVKVAVVTNKAQPFAEKVVRKLYGDRFEIICGLVDGMPAKPDPTAALSVMKKLGVTPKECAFIGDTAMDIKTGVNTGAYPIGVLWGFREREELVQAGAKKLAENAEQLLNLLLYEELL